MNQLVDLAEIRRLLEIVERQGLDGLHITEGEAEVAITAPLPESAGAAVAVAEAPPVEPGLDSRFVPLRSPVTGVFYRAANPGDPPFVQEGEVVDEDDTVCLIEAMKIFNEINAGTRGRIARIVAQNEQLVVAGEVLMEFDPLGEEQS